MARRWRLWIAVWLALAFSCAAMAQEQSITETRGITLPTARPSGIPRNDRIWLTLFRPDGPGPYPAVILLHPLGEWRNTLMLDFGRYLARHGMIGIVVELPYHMHRLVPHDNPLRHYTSSNIDAVHQAFTQSISDVRTITDWLAARPDVDHRRIGVIGASLGAIIAHTAMGQDARLSAGVAVLGGADFPDLYRRSILFRALHPEVHRSLTPLELEKLAEIDPLTYADRNRPRRVLMIQAARDDIIPASNAAQLWRAMGRPPIVWLDTNHYAPALNADSVREYSLDFLRRQWGLGTLSPPPVYAPTLKLSLTSGLDVPASVGLEWQTVSLLQRPNHMSLLHFDIGLDLRGPYIGFAGTVNAYLDVGYGRRFGRADWRPYVSIHITL